MKKYNEYLQRISFFLSRYPREYFAFLGFGVVLLMIVWELFSFTIVNHAYYKDLATRQQTSQIKMPVNRGAILSSNEKGNVLAVSIDLNDLAIDPMAAGNKQKLAEFLTDVVYRDTCYLESSTNCRKSLTKFLGVLEIPDFRMNETFVKSKISAKLDEKINRNKVTSVLLKSDLTNEQVFEIEKLNLSGVYLNGTNIYVNPEEVSDSSFVGEKLSPLLSIDVEALKRSIRKRDLRYVIILNKLSIGTSEYVKQKISDENQALSKGFIDKKDVIGSFIILNPNPHRFYPESDMGANVLGFVNSNGEGNYGIEGYYNNILKGKESSAYSKKDIAGRPIEPISLDDETNLAGANITLTIDRNVQKAVEEIIDTDNVQYKANSISVIVMDPKTGAVIAMATNPRYDPNNPGDAFELEKVTPDKYSNPYVDLIGTRVMAVDNRNGTEYFYDGKKIFLREALREELNDRSIEKYVFTNKRGGGVYKNDIMQDLYEPGSIFKPIVFSAAIDSGEMNRYDMYKDEGFVQIDNFKIKNVSHQCMGYNTFQNAMNYSCNVGMIRIAQKIGASIFYKYLDSYGFGKKTGITLEGEVYGRLDPYEKWSRAQLFTTSFGQGITATMLQMAGVYSVLANGGVYYRPQIVKSIEFSDGKKITYKPEAVQRVIKESTSKIMTDVLVDSVDHGVAKNGAVKGYSIAGKTGTAQIAYKGQYESGQASTMGFYAGYGPAEDPKFVMIVKVERPRSSIFGGETVARTFSHVAEYLLNYYKIPPKNVK